MGRWRLGSGVEICLTGADVIYTRGADVIRVPPARMSSTRCRPHLRRQHGGLAGATRATPVRPTPGRAAPAKACSSRSMRANRALVEPSWPGGCLDQSQLQLRAGIGAGSHRLQSGAQQVEHPHDLGGPKRWACSRKRSSISGVKDNSGGTSPKVCTTNSSRARPSKSRVNEAASRPPSAQRATARNAARASPAWTASKASESNCSSATPKRPRHPPKRLWRHCR